MKIRILLSLVLALSLGLAACDFGKVEQGRCVAYDKENKKVTVMLDNHDVENPIYEKDSVEYLMPADPKETGPEPTPGGRLKVDLEKKVVTIYDAEAKKALDLAVEFTDVQKGVPASDARLAGRTFPEIKDGVVTEYSKRLKALFSFRIPEDKASLPKETWHAGDEVRVYYKENAKHQALRFMNISQTNIYKR